MINKIEIWNPSLLKNFDQQVLSQNKEAFKTAKFLQSYAKDKGMKLDKCLEPVLGGDTFASRELWKEIPNLNEREINDLLHIKSKGSVSGKIFYGSIQIDDGGKLLGEINYRDKNNKQEEFKDWKPL